MFSFHFHCRDAVLVNTENTENNGKSFRAKNRKATTFMPQEVQPIEEKPSMMSMEISSESELHRLDVQRPQMDELDSSDDVINSILSSADQVAILLQNQDLLNSAYSGNR